MYLRYILLDVLVCIIAEYFYELCRTLTSTLSESKFKQQSLILLHIIKTLIRGGSKYY